MVINLQCQNRVTFHKHICVSLFYIFLKASQKKDRHKLTSDLQPCLERKRFNDKFSFQNIFVPYDFKMNTLDEVPSYSIHIHSDLSTFIARYRVMFVEFIVE